MSNRYLFKVIVFIVIIGTACNKDRHSISGKVYNHDGSSSTSVIEVEGRSKSNTTSGSNGNFEIENLSKGESYKVKFTSQNPDGSFSSKTEELTVGSDGVVIELPNPVILRPLILQPGLGKDTIHLSWSKSLSVDFREYKVYRHTNAGLDETTGMLIYVATNANDTSFADEINHNDTYFYRVFVLNDYGLLGGSNIEFISGIPVQNDPLLHIGVDNTYYMNPGDLQWFDFSLKKGAICKITWRDSWFQPYNANSIYLGVYHSDMQSNFIPDTRLIQMTGGPQTFVFSSDETAHVKTYGWNQDTHGTYFLRVDTLDKSLATQLSFNTANTIPVFTGETKLLFFDAQKDTSYKVVFSGSFGGGAGDGLSVQLSCYSGANGTVLINKDWVSNAQYADTVTLVPTNTERLYIDLTASFWGAPPTGVSLKIIK